MHKGGHGCFLCSAQGTAVAGIAVCSTGHGGWQMEWEVVGEVAWGLEEGLEGGLVADLRGVRQLITPAQAHQ